jgi:DNA-directed RNA polymerase subunit RPC12/RpoP
MIEQQPELLSNSISEITPEEQAKRDEYRQRLAEYLKDPDFRAIEGFPIGTDEDILALSDPPYYTACPNPFLPEIIEEWQQEREVIRKQLGFEGDNYQHEPFAADVSEGRHNWVYKAHTYHTKVPPRAVAQYILHYTNPGDIIFDGFCGSGMTGIAAQQCNSNKLSTLDNSEGISFGPRFYILGDLSPAATYITYGYNNTFDPSFFKKETERILGDVEKQLGWLVETHHVSTNIKGNLNYAVWSDVYLCPNCGKEVVFAEEALDLENELVKDEFPCPHCGLALRKSIIKRVIETYYDVSLEKTKQRYKQVPTQINYSVGKKRFRKKVDSFDFEIIQRAEQVALKSSPFIIPMLFREGAWGDQWHSCLHHQFSTHAHHFFSARQHIIADAILKRLNSYEPTHKAILFLLTSCLQKASKLMVFNADGIGRVQKGTLYVSSIWQEMNLIHLMRISLNDLLRATNEGLWQFNNSNNSSKGIITTGSTTSLQIPSGAIDYIFTDPPFADNIPYSELNFIWEAALRVFTSTTREAVVNKTQRKALADYQDLMENCFKEYLRVLKPGRWITVEFHNSKNAVWNAIQEALLRSGFVIADVRTLDKKQGTFKQVTTSGAVKQDLIISAYKPNGNLEENFRLKAGTEDGAWEFVRYHLGKLPVVNESNGIVIVNVERQPFLLFDRMVAFHIQRGVMVPVSASEFYAGLEQRFTSRDGMHFLPDQVAEYDRAVLESGKPTQLSLFVNDEKTAITWLRQQLDPASNGEPKTQGDLTNDFNRVMNRAKHEQPLELIELLKQNFLQDEDGKWYVPDHNKANDLEKIRARSLLKEFKEYTQSKGRLKVFRSEAVRAGFADCFKNQDYETIVNVAERLPERVLREDPNLLMYYDSAQLRKK